MPSFKNKFPFFSVLLVFMVSFLACQQVLTSQEAPQAVQDNFNKMYPGEDNPNWHVDAHGYYEAHFKKDGIKYRADYNEDGSWYETETSIKVKELPKAIRKVIEEQYAHLEISEVEKVQHHSKGLFYDVEFKRKGKNKDIEFKEDGTILYITP